MRNPNRGTSSDVLDRLKAASYERMRVELKCSVELKMKDFGMTWDDFVSLMGNGKTLKDGDMVRKTIIQGRLTLKQLNDIAHIFSCEPYIIFRPREPWTKT